MNHVPLRLEAPELEPNDELLGRLAAAARASAPLRARRRALGLRLGVATAGLVTVSFGGAWATGALPDVLDRDPRPVLPAPLTPPSDEAPPASPGPTDLPGGQSSVAPDDDSTDRPPVSGGDRPDQVPPRAPGPPTDPGQQGGPASQGQGDGPPADPGSQGQGDGPPADPGTQGQGDGPPADPGTQGQGDGPPADPGSQGQGQGQGQDQGNGPPTDPGSQGQGDGPPATPGSQGQDNPGGGRGPDRTDDDASPPGPRSRRI